MKKLLFITLISFLGLLSTANLAAKDDIDIEHELEMMGDLAYKKPRLLLISVKAIQVFQSPTMLRAVLNKDFGVLTFRVYDATGAMVYEGTVNSKVSESWSLNISSYDSGSYQIEISDSGYNNSRGYFVK